jgi:hypothetical protein
METEIVKEPVVPVVPVQDTEEMLPGKQAAKLMNWTYRTWRAQLCGNVYDHPRFDDGTYIYTSHVLDLNRELGIAETLNTVYILVGKETVEPGE